MYVFMCNKTKNVCMYVCEQIKTILKITYLNTQSHKHILIQMLRLNSVISILTRPNIKDMT